MKCYGLSCATFFFSANFLSASSFCNAGASLGRRPNLCEILIAFSNFLCCFLQTPVSLRLRRYPLGDINWDKNSTSLYVNVISLLQIGQPTSALFILSSVRTEALIPSKLCKLKCLALLSTKPVFPGDGSPVLERFFDTLTQIEACIQDELKILEKRRELGWKKAIWLSNFARGSNPLAAILKTELSMETKFKW